MTARAPGSSVAAVITGGPEAVTGVRAAHTIGAAVVLTPTEVPVLSVRHGTEVVLVAEVGTPALGRTPTPWPLERTPGQDERRPQPQERTPPTPRTGNDHHPHRSKGLS